MLILDIFPYWPLAAMVSVGFVLGFYGLHQRLKRKTRAQVQHNIRQLKLLRALVGNLQRHRGLCSGVLSGDDSLRAQLSNTRATVDQLMQEAQGLTTNQADGWLGLTDHWSRLRNPSNTECDYIINQHHQIIRNAIFLMEDVAEEIDLTQGEPHLRYLSCIWQEIIPAAEWAGQARALGTSMAAAGKSSAEQRVRMRFLHYKIMGMANTAFNTLRAHPDSNRFRLQHCEKTVQGLLQFIDRELLSDSRPEIEARQYFSQATLAVDELLSIADAALNDLAASQPDSDRKPVNHAMQALDPAK